MIDSLCMLVYYSIVNQHTPEITPWEINSCFRLIFNDSNKLEKSGGQCFIAQGPNEQIHHYTTTSGWLTFIGGWLTFILSPNKNGDVAKKHRPRKRGTWITLQFPGNFRVFHPFSWNKITLGAGPWYAPFKKVHDFLRLDDWFVFAHVCSTPPTSSPTSI